MKKNYVIFTLALFLFQSLLFSADDFPIATDNFSQTYPVVVFDGEDYLTVYFDRRGGNYSVFSKFVSTDGVVSSEQQTVPAHPALSLMPGLAIGDDNFLYTWSRQRGIWDYQRDGMAILIGLNGVPVSGMIQVSSPALQNSPGFMRTAYDGENYLVIWQDGMPNQDAQILGQFVSASDYNLVGSNFPIRPPSLGSNHAQVYPDILFDGTNYLVVWDDNRTGERSIYGWFIDTDGNPVGDDFVISNVPQRQMLVRAAFNGSEYMAVWADRRDGSKSGVYGQLFDSNGTLIGGNIPISPLADNHERTWPKVGSNGNQFLVAWEQQNISKSVDKNDPVQEEMLLAAGMDPAKQNIWWEVHGRIINSDGSFYTDEMPIGVNQFHQQNPEVAGQGNQFLTVWQDSRVNNQYSDIYGRFETGVPADVLPVPENLTAEFTGEGIHLNWNPPAEKNLLHYNVYRDGNLIAQEVQDTEYLDEDFEQSTTYSYHVTAVYDSGESGPSNTAIVDIPVLYVTVTFHVNDQDNMAIEGAQVILGEYDPQLTDSEGVAIFDQVDANSTFSYEVSKEYYNAESGTIEVQEEDITETVTLIFTPLTYVSVGFVVTDIEDNPIQGAEIWFEGGNGTETTDASGTVVFWEVEPNDLYHYEVWKEGYFADIDMVEVLDEDLIVEIVLIVDDTSVFDAQQDALFNISPNPANELLRISGPETVRHIEIIDVNGSRVKRYVNINQDNTVLDISDLKSGMHVLVIQDQQGGIHRMPFIKE